MTTKKHRVSPTARLSGAPSKAPPRYKMKTVARMPADVRAAAAEYHAAGKPARLLIDYFPDGSTRVVSAAGLDAAGSDRFPNIQQAEILAAARERGRISAAKILTGPEMLDAEQMASRLGLTTVSVGNKRKRHELLGLVGASTRNCRFPEWQLDENDTPYSALPDIFDRIGGSEWSVYRYLTTRHSELDGMTGIEALRAGRTQEVIDVAESVVRSFA